MQDITLLGRPCSRFIGVGRLGPTDEECGSGQASSLQFSGWRSVACPITTAIEQL